MALASSTRQQLRYIAEATWGTTPASGNSTELRMTGQSLDYQLNKDYSKEINATRQVRSLSVTKADASGGIDFDFSYKEYDALLAGAFQSSWSTFGTAGVATAANATFTTSTLVYASAPTGNDALTNLQAGQFVRIQCAVTSDPNHNKILPVVSASGTTITFAAGSLTTNAAAQLVTVSSAALTNGTTRQSFTLEVQYSDVNQFWAFRGMEVNKLDLKLSTGQFVSGSFGFIGKDGRRLAATAMPGSPVASQAGSVMSAVSGIKGILLDNVDFSTTYQTYIKDLSISLDNGMSGLDAVGTAANVDLLNGTLKVEGSMSVYLNNGSLYDDFINAVRHDVAIAMVDSSNQGYVLYLPEIEFSGANVKPGSIDTPVMLDLKFQALQDTTASKVYTNKSICLFRV